MKAKNIEEKAVCISHPTTKKNSEQPTRQKTLFLHQNYCLNDKLAKASGLCRPLCHAPKSTLSWLMWPLPPPTPPAGGAGGRNGLLLPAPGATGAGVATPLANLVARFWGMLETGARLSCCCCRTGLLLGGGASWG